MAQETPADRVKREAAEKAEMDKLDAEKKALEEAAEKEAAGIAADEARDKLRMEQEKASYEAGMFAEEAKPNPAEQARSANDEAARAAYDKLHNIAQSYPLTTPGEHTIFGFGGFKFTLGELRTLCGLQHSR